MKNSASKKVQTVLAGWAAKELDRQCSIHGMTRYAVVKELLEEQLALSKVDDEEDRSDMRSSKNGTGMRAEVNRQILPLSKTTLIPQSWQELRSRVAGALASDEISDLGYEGPELQDLHTVWQWVEGILKEFPDEPEEAQADWESQGPHMVYSALVEPVGVETAKQVAAAVAGSRGENR